MPEIDEFTHYCVMVNFWKICCWSNMRISRIGKAVFKACQVAVPNIREEQIPQALIKEIEENRYDKQRVEKIIESFVIKL